MPLGGYCDECGRWVWLTPYGDCENGHKARNVRDIQQLRPSQSTALAEQEAELVAETSRTVRFRFWWRHSLWIGWTLTGGFFNWVAFMYISARSRYKPWALYGFLYLLPLILTMVAWGTPFGRAFLALQLVVGAGSFLHALYLRPYYRAVMFGDMVRRRLPAPPEPPPLLAATDRPALPRGGGEHGAEVVREARTQVDEILDTARGIGKPHVRDEVVRLCRTADQILAELSAEPRKVPAARGFLTYYLDAAQRIVASYADLSTRGVAAGDAAQTLARAEQSLASVQQAFDQELQAVLQDQVLDLEAEIELLQKTVSMDSLYRSAPADPRDGDSRAGDPRDDT